MAGNKNGKDTKGKHFTPLNSEMDKEYGTLNWHGSGEKGEALHRKWGTDSFTKADYTATEKVGDDPDFTSGVFEWYSKTVTISESKKNTATLNSISIADDVLTRCKKLNHIKKDCYENNILVYTQPKTGVLTTIDIENKTYEIGLKYKFWDSKEDCVNQYKERIHKVNWRLWFDDEQIDVYSFVFRFFDLEVVKSETIFIERDIYSLDCSSYEEGDNLWTSYAKESKRLTDSLDKSLPSHPRHITADFLKKKLNEQTNKFNKEKSDMWNDLFKLDKTQNFTVDSIKGGNREVVFRNLNAEFDYNHLNERKLFFEQRCSEIYTETGINLLSDEEVEVDESI